MTRLIIILLIVAIITGIGLWLGHERRKRLTNEVDATISRVEVRTLTPGPTDRGRFETDLFYSYSVDGQTYEARSTKQGKRDDAYKPGDTGRVRFNPQKPGEADVIAPQ
jgi:Protein of unknown function (DUF3592)